ncbi:MAG: hypothetical protein BroJett005_30740 [Ignavibacteriota bacterium]|nr:MAG: hypothetical protein BroJett005_30740 [Ignavibacteriota bacterium]
MEQLIEQAKRLIEKKFDPGRKWLEASLDSYNADSNRVTLFVLEGSPAKGYIIANYGTKQVIAFDYYGRKRRTYSLHTRYLRAEFRQRRQRRVLG